jgi:hypothetical protein
MGHRRPFLLIHRVAYISWRGRGTSFDILSGAPLDRAKSGVLRYVLKLIVMRPIC